MIDKDSKDYQIVDVEVEDLHDNQSNNNNENDDPSKKEKETIYEEKIQINPSSTSFTPNYILLILIILFAGFLGLDKLYVTKGSKVGVFYCIGKLLFTLTLIGGIWNLLDLVFAIIKRYRLNPISYFNEEKGEQLDLWVENFVKKN